MTPPTLLPAGWHPGGAGGGRGGAPFPRGGRKGLEVGVPRGEVCRLERGVRGVVAVHELGGHVRLTSLVNPVVRLTSLVNPVVPRVLPACRVVMQLAGVRGSLLNL